MVAKSVVEDSAIQPDMIAPRVDVQRLLRVLFLSTLLPLGAIILIDYYAGLWPFLTFAGLVIILPIGTFLTSRAALDEMNKVIDEVAPADDDNIGVDVTDTSDY